VPLILLSTLPIRPQMEWKRRHQTEYFDFSFKK
jgi:hypothetical protein